MTSTGDRSVLPTNPYEEREQTLAKHVILKSYLQALAFKILQSTFRALTYVDGFSGPWKSQTESFSDTSFMITIEVLKDAQQRVFDMTGRRKAIRCLLIEKDAEAYGKLAAAVKEHNEPAKQFLVETLHGEFEGATERIMQCVGTFFALVFIDPTGWTGYGFDRTRPVLRHQPGEVLVNFMYDHANRFALMEDPAIEASFAPIMGGPDWKQQLDLSLPASLAMEKRFRDELKKAGDFKFVTTTHINKPLAERTHFIMAYGTRHPKGLETFRQIEYTALCKHEQNRVVARDSRTARTTGQGALFSAGELHADQTIDQEVAAQKAMAESIVLQHLTSCGGRMLFSELVTLVLEPFMLRIKNVKDLCVALAKGGKVKNTWKAQGRNKPQDTDWIILKGA
jgi:three-Cys-motif partner protein